MIANAFPFLLPLVTYYFWLCLRTGDGAFIPPSLDVIRQIPAPTITAIAVYLGWFSLQAVLHLLLPGRIQQGEPLADGTRLRYKLNGWLAFWTTLALVVLLVISGWIPATLLYDQFGAVLSTANIFAFIFSFFLYVRGRGRSLQHYVMGAALHPRLRDFDFKFFCESRPGLILWVLLNLSFAAKQYEIYGTVTVPMILVTAFQFLYVADYFFYEEAILSTWDIKHEKLGWMLLWGSLVWVPFMYSLQAHYLVNHTTELPATALAAIVGLNVLGYAIFRSANIQKHNFRKNPEAFVWGKRPEYIQTMQGSLLLTSGWWGIARHLNHTGDLLMAAAWCLPTGFGHPLPYFYLVYFAILLLHRESRVDAMCRHKYGNDWLVYCKKVRWRLIPGIY